MSQPSNERDDAQGPDSLDRVPTLGSGPSGTSEIGGFRLESKLGRGGMGEVWKAWDPTAERFVVVKLVPSDVQNAEEEMARVKETFARVHDLQHQHVCPLYLLGNDPQRGYFVVMKFIDGQTLSAYRRTYVARHGSFPLEQVIRVLGPVADALDYAHAHKVIHRDIKPQNILVVGDADDVQIVDFGLAAQIQTSLSRVSQVRMDTSGTRPYMAPEQWKAGFQDARTDQYSLGVVAYELLSGCLPFESPDFDILRACVLNDPPEQLADQPQNVDRAIARALAKRREERFGTCREFVQSLLSSSSTGQSAKVEPKTPPEEPRRPCPACGKQLRLKASAAGKELPCPGCNTMLKVAADLHQVTVKMTRPILEKEFAVDLGNGIKLEMVLIPAGEFLMGSPDSDNNAQGDEKPQHRVRITNPFYLGKYPVTQEQWQAVMGNNPSHFKGPQNPVEQVSWKDCQRFLAEINTKIGTGGGKFQLPSEAQWEYACRAGSAGRYCFGDQESALGEFAWHKGNSGSKTHTVGEKNPNAWGLYDVHGNVWEWCQDWYDAGYYAKSPTDDPIGHATGSHRVARGGSWFHSAGFCWSAVRYSYKPEDRGFILGLRVARVMADK